MKIAPTLAMVTAASILTGCGMLPSMPFIGGEDKPEKTTYIDLQPQAPLEVPADLRQVEPSQVSAIPEIGVQRNASYYPDRPPLPDAKYASDNRDEVRMQRLGSRREKMRTTNGAAGAAGENRTGNAPKHATKQILTTV